MAGVIPGRNDKLAAAGAGAGATANVAVAPAARSGFWAFLTGPWPTLVSRLALGFIFALAGLTKLGVPATFTASIQSYEMPLPDFLVQAMAYALPALELGLGIWLLIGLVIYFAYGRKHSVLQRRLRGEAVEPVAPPLPGGEKA